MLLLRAAVVAAFAAIPSVIGCAAEDVSAERSWDPELQEGGPGGRACAPQTCSSAGKTCGTHDDGCGGQIDCGRCVGNACTPKTCEELGRTCGQVDDECGGVVDCGECPTCQADAQAGNDAPDKAADLGTMTDSPASTKKVEALWVGEGEEDWFKFKVTDGGLLGNPLIRASVGAAPLEVSAFFLCDAESNDSSCPVEGEKADASVGMGCTGNKTATVWTQCSGLTENGTAFVRVRRAAGAGDACVSYTLDLRVEQKAW